MKNILRNIYKLLLKLLPENRFIDHFVAFIDFVRAHRRLPSQRRIFNDVLYQIKTTDEIIDPLRVFISDKEFVKIYVKAVIGDQFNVPTIKILHTIEEVENYDFPSDCCIKPAHLSGKVILRRQNSPVDLCEIKKWINSSHYQVNREANYKNLKHKVIVEPLIFNSVNLFDYKFFCYNGKPKLIQIDIDRNSEHTRKYYDCDWNEMPFSLYKPRSTSKLERPNNLQKMLEVASSLSRQFNFVRIDLYSNGEECLVGEITNCHGNAWESFIPESGELLASNLIFGNS